MAPPSPPPPFPPPPSSPPPLPFPPPLPTSMIEPCHDWLRGAGYRRARLSAFDRRRDLRRRPILRRAPQGEGKRGP